MSSSHDEMTGRGHVLARPIRWELPAWLRRGCLALSVLLCAVLTTCYALRADTTTALTLLPPWLWLGPGVVLTLIGWHRAEWRWSVAVLSLWLFFLAVFTEEPVSLARALRSTDSEWDSARRRGAAVRVISLNCNGGNTNAALEVEAFHPDIVLLQESPRNEFNIRLARRLFGEKSISLGNGDSSMIARGEAIAASSTDRQRFCHTRIRLVNGLELELFCVRLSPYQVRVDLWRLDCWREQAVTRREHRQQIEPLIRQLASIPATTPVMVGGDFNEPANDAVPRLLSPRLHDTFREAGRGWGNTILNDFPVLRIDQVWVSDQFRATTVRAVPTMNSDHRMVICDLWLP